MAWSFTEVFSLAASGRETKSMVAHGGRLWAVTNANHLISGNSGRIFYSSGGDSWTEDAAWTGPADVGTSATWEGQIFVHQGFLHLIANFDRGGANQGRLYRRQNGSWVQLHGEATEKVYSRAYSNDAWIVIGGTDFTPVGHSEAFVSVWNGTTMTEEFNGGGPGFPYDNAAYDTVYYNSEWYVFVTRWLDAVTMQYALRNRGDGSWPWYRSGGGALTVALQGLFFGEELWKTSGEWVDTNFPGNMGRAAYQAGLFVGTRDTTSDQCYTYINNTWYIQGSPEAGCEIRCYAYFEGFLYIGGYDGSSPAGPRIWRATFYHDTTLTHWTRPTARSLVCDHEFGDTIYFGIYTNAGKPAMMKIDDDLEDWYQIYYSTSGSFIQVQTALERNVAYAFGFFGTDDQIQVTPDAGGIFYDCDDDWGEDKITTMEYLPSSGSDLTITNYEDEDLLRTTSGSASWEKRGDIPGWPLSQLRHTGGSIIFVGCTGGSLFKSEDIGITYALVGAGLPTVDILDLEIA